MKGFEFILLGIGAVCGAFFRYKIVESPLIVFGGLPLNVLIVNIIGSFILGIFSGSVKLRYIHLFHSIR